MSAANCAKCANPVFASYVPNPQALSYSRGDIIAIHERVSAPIYEVLQANPSSRPANGSTYTWGSVGSTSRRSTGGAPPPRPGILLRAAEIESLPRAVRVCLLASFDGETNFNALPRVIRHFCAPLYPHFTIQPGHAHYHTIPDWSREDMWLLAIAFNSSARIAGRWEDRRWWAEPGASFSLSPQDLQTLQSICDQRLESWQTLYVKDPGLQTRALREYQAFKGESAEKRKHRSQNKALPSTPQAGPSTPQTGPSTPQTGPSPPQAGPSPPRAGPSQDSVSKRPSVLKSAAHRVKQAFNKPGEQDAAPAIAPSKLTAEALLHRTITETDEAGRAPSIAATSAASTKSHHTDSPLLRGVKKLFTSSSKSNLSHDGA